MISAQTSRVRSIRGAVSRRDVGLAEAGRRRAPGRRLHVPMGGPAGVCPHRGRRQLPDLGVPLARRRPQRHRLWTHRGAAHLQERYGQRVAELHDLTHTSAKAAQSVK